MAIIQNVNVDGIIISTKSYIGGITGYQTNNTIVCCCNEGNIYAKSNYTLSKLGGITGDTHQ